LRNHCCRGEAISITYSECVFVALVMQHAKFIRRILVHLWPLWIYNIFPHYLINGKIFGKKLNIKFVFGFSLQLLSKIFLILRRIQLDTVINVRRSSCKVPVIHVIF
jgi:hypothetical protein